MLQIHAKQVFAFVTSALCNQFLLMMVLTARLQKMDQACAFQASVKLFRYQSPANFVASETNVRSGHAKQGFALAAVKSSVHQAPSERLVHRARLILVLRGPATESEATAFR